MDSQYTFKQKKSCNSLDKSKLIYTVGSKNAAKKNEKYN